MDTWWLLLFVSFALVVISDSITVSPGQEIHANNCSGQVDYFLCNCLASNDIIDIYLLPGRYVFNSYSCTLANKTSVMITSSSPDETTIQCHGFNIMFMSAQNVTINNLKLEGCGGGTEDSVKVSFHPFLYLGQGSRFMFLFANSTDITLNNVMMENTLGYGIVAFDTNGLVKLIGVHIENTQFHNDERCIGYNYDSHEADFTCSGSGVMFVYHYTAVGNSTLIIDNCSFKHNVNILPKNLYEIYNNAINIGYYSSPLPIVGAGSIALYFTQNDFPVSVSISNTEFYNNTGTYSGGVTVTSIYSILGQTRFYNCLFQENNHESTLIPNNFPYQNGGIKLLYLNLVEIGNNKIPDFILPGPTEEKMLTIAKCNFKKLVGAVRVEKLSANNLTVVVTIQECNFTENIASTGAVVTALDNNFRKSTTFTTFSAIKVHMTDVNAMENDFFTDNDFINGVFLLFNVQANLRCTAMCKFWYNHQSVFYGRNSELTLIGNMSFEHNHATFGGALRLINTVVFFHTGAQVYFAHNSAQINGGAISAAFTNTNVQSQDVCPIQFVGLAEPVFSVNKTDLEKLNLCVSFENNTVGVNNGFLESISSNVFYLCSFYTQTSLQTNYGLHTSVENDTRTSVYQSVLTYLPTGSGNNHTYILSLFACLCDDERVYNFTACSGQEKDYLSQTVIPGRLFNISLISLDLVGSVGYAEKLYSTAYRGNSISDQKLLLDNGQDERPFSLTNRTCSNVEFTVYSNRLKFSGDGLLRLSLNRQIFLDILFEISDCPVGFEEKKIDGGRFKCACDRFFDRLNGRFNCDATTGMIKRLHRQAWLSTNDGGLEYAKICSPTYCQTGIITFDLSERDVLCTNHHAGRMCGGCEDDFSRVFGSDACKRCSNTWLVTILLYLILGLLLLLVLYLLKFDVTFGVINGLIFFCNVMGINEELFFNTEFSFLRVFISLVNLDLGFEICFYDGMSQLAKTGLQFVFPVYLWILMLIIIYVRKLYFRRIQTLSSRSALPILATLLLLAYSKVLRTIISAFSLARVKSSNEGSIYVWQPDPNIKYLTNIHTLLFIVGVILFVGYVLPFAFGLTFPSLMLRSKRLNYFFPLFDCFFAPYKGKYRHWFGLRAFVLIYLSVMEVVIFDFREALLLSSIAVVGLFAVIQSYIRPFKNKITNILDLAFMGVFLLLSAVALYFSPTTSGYAEVNIAVSVFGSIGFILFLLVVLYHIYQISKHTKLCMWLIEQYQKTVNKIQNSSNFSPPRPPRNNTFSLDHSYVKVGDLPQLPEEQFQESLFEHL